MKKYRVMLLWFLCIFVSWSIYRLFDFPEEVTEIVAKSLIWIGLTTLFILKQWMPRAVIASLKNDFLHIFPLWKIILPSLLVLAYFLIIYLSEIHLSNLTISLTLMALLVNVPTAIVEEFVFRGVLYVWMLQKTNEVRAFIIVQMLFYAIHVPILITEFVSLPSLLTRTFFIVFMGAIYTLIFRTTKSLYASILAHGLWNSLVYLAMFL